MKPIQDTNLITNVMVISKTPCFYTKLATAGEFVHQNSVCRFNGLNLGIKDWNKYLEKVAKKDP